MNSAPFHMELNRKSVVRNIATLFSGSVVAQGTTALVLLLTARQLGADAYGQYAVSIAFASFTAILFSLGLDHWLLREGGRHLRPLSELVGSVLVIKLIGGLIWFGLLLFIAPVLNQDTYPVDLMRLCAISVGLDILFSTTLTGFKASLQNRVTSLLEAGSDVLWLLVTLLVIFSGERQAIVFIKIRIFVLMISLFISIFLVRRLIGVNAALPTMRRALFEAFPFATSDLLAWITMRMDVLIIGFTLGKQAAGLYSPAVGLVNALFLVPTAVYYVMMPILSHLYITNTQQARQTAQNTILLLAVAGIALSVIFVIGAPVLVAILGQSYQGSLPVMRILGILLFFKSLSFAQVAILVAIGQQARRTAVQAIVGISNVILNLLVVFRFGITGVAWVYVVTEIITMAGYTWLSRRYRSKVAVIASTPSGDQSLPKYP
ncbi:MAG: oligosaccharide flippase family protein [Omnitrophica WOR_2 bacterium]